MAEAPLSPQLQALLFQHRLEQRRARQRPREVPALTTQVFEAPPVPVAPPVPSVASKPPALAPDYKGSEIQAKYDTERMQQAGATEREGMQQRGAMDRAKLNALTEIEGLRFKVIAKRAGGGHGGNLEAYLKAAADMAKAAEGSAERNAMESVLRTRYQGLPRQYRERVEASGLGFGFAAKGPAGSDIKLTADYKRTVAERPGKPNASADRLEAEANKLDATAARVLTGEKAQDAMVRGAMGGADLRKQEADRLKAQAAKLREQASALRSGQAPTASEPEPPDGDLVPAGRTPDGKKLYRQRDGSLLVEE